MNKFKGYEKTNEKPDKKYVILPTSLKILGNLKDKIVIDIGCGDGFFTKEISKDAKFVYGIDNSKEQIAKAKKVALENVKYILEDMNKYIYPACDIILSPFVLNYLKEEKQVSLLLQRFYNALNKGGKIVGILDMPKRKVHNLKKFGVIKKIDSFQEGQKIDVELYNGENHIITLHSYYHDLKVIEKLLQNTGFKKIVWHKPIISEEGIKEKGEEFWKGYLDDCDLGYFSAEK